MYVFPNRGSRRRTYWSKCREQTNVSRKVKCWCAQRLGHDGSNTVTNVGIGHPPSRDYGKSHQATSYLQAPRVRKWFPEHASPMSKCSEQAVVSRNVKCSLKQDKPGLLSTSTTRTSAQRVHRDGKESLYSLSWYSLASGKPALRKTNLHGIRAKYRWKKMLTGGAHARQTDKMRRRLCKKRWI
jgi:hypothetical protein